MNRHTLTRLAAATSLSILTGAAILPMTGCESGGLGGLMGSSGAMDMLPAPIKEAANTYLTSLASLTESMGSLNTVQGVMNFGQQVQPMMDDLTAAYQTLAGTSGDDRTNVMKAFGPQIEVANTAFETQAEAVSKNNSWSNALAPVLDKVKLFQPG